MLSYSEKVSRRVKRVDEGMAKDENRYIIHSVSTALALLNSLSMERRELSLTEISSRLDLNPSTTFRILATLQAHSFLEQNPDNRKYRLGVACLELCSAYLSQVDVRRQALPVMRRLRDECRETVHLAILAGSEVVYLERLDPLEPIGVMGSAVGSRAPAHCTALGKAMLACKSDAEIRHLYEGSDLIPRTPNSITDLEELLLELSRIRTVDYAIDNQENEIGVYCVAVPLFGYAAKVTSAISVSGPVERIRRAIAEDGLVAKVQQAGRQISRREGRMAMSQGW
jgi:IclR family KDG regulon transcriptional repressor